MEANELMVGDLVIANYKTDEQVYAKIGHLYPCYGDLEHDSIGFIPCASIGHLEQYINDERGINPIPLTEEILKANGWQRDRSGRYKHVEGSVWCYCFADCKEVRVHIVDGKGFLFAYIYPWYELIFHHVHELQHALRLCGLTELADNFKIK